MASNKITPANPTNLNRTVKYQPQSVVSQELIKNQSGNVTLFAFAKGEGLSEHTAPFDALVYIINGQANIQIEGKPHTVKKGEYIIMPANKPHSLLAIDKFKMMLIMIKS